MSTESKLPTHKNLKDRVAAFQRLNQQNNLPSNSPSLSVTSSPPDPSLATSHSNSNANNNTKGSLRDKIAIFEAAGAVPQPGGSFGMGAIPSHHDETSRRKGEMVGNRVPGLNRPRALPTDGLGMASKSHLTVRPVAKDPTHYHNPAGSQSLGNHRRYTSQLYSALTSPSLSAYDGEGGGGLSEPDEFGGLNGLGTPQTPYSTYSTASNYSTPSSPEVSAIDKLPGKLVIPGKFQRRVVSDYQASYGPARALTPDPEMPLQPLGEETPLSSANCGSSPQLEAEPIPDPRTYDDPKGLEVQLPTERTPELQVAPSEGHLSPPTDSPREIAIETAPGRTSSKFISVGNVVEGSGEEQGRQQSPDIVPPTQVQDHDPIQEVSIPSPIFVPSSPVMDSTDPSPQVSPSISTPSTTTSITGVPPVIVQVERPHELVERVVPSNQPRPDSDDAPTSCKTPTSPVLAFPRPPANLSAVDNPSFQLRTPPESPTHASFISTSTSDLSDSTIDYQSRLNHPDPDHDLFVLPLPKDEELPPRQVIREATAGRSMPQALASPLPTLQSPIDFPFTTAKIVSAGSSDPNTSLNGDESPALDASQAEIVIAQSEIIRPASPTFLVSMPTPSPTATAFRLQMPPPPGEDNQTQGPPTRIRKKLHTNNSVPTSFKDTLSPPPTQQSFSAVVHQKTRTSTYVLPPDRVDSLPSKTSSKPVNVFMTPKKKQSSFTEPLGFASPGSELASLVKSAAILEAQLQRGTDSSGDGGSERVDSARRSRSMSRSEKVRVKSASTPALLSTPVTTPGHIPPVPDLVYDDGSSNSGWSSNRHIPPFLPQFRSRKSAAHEDADRKSLAPSHKSRKSEKSTKEKGDSSIPRARKLSARLRSLASSSTNSLKSLGRPSLSSETSVSFDSPATVSIDLMTPQDTGNSEDGRLGIGIGSPGGRSQTSRGSGSEWSTSPRRRDVVGRASSFADRFLSRAGRTKSGVLDDSQDSISSDYLSPTRTSPVSSKAFHETQRGTSPKDEFGTAALRTVSPPRVDIPYLRNEEATMSPSNTSSPGGLLPGLKSLSSIPLTPSTPDSSSFFDTTELFDAFPSVPQNLPAGPGTSLLSGFELGGDLDLGLRGVGKATISSSYRPKSTYR